MTKTIEWLRDDAATQRRLGRDHYAERLFNAADEMEEMLKALKECAAEYRSPPTTVAEGAALVGQEFQRRMNVAANAYRSVTTGERT